MTNFVGTKLGIGVSNPLDILDINGTLRSKGVVVSGQTVVDTLGKIDYSILKNLPTAFTPLEHTHDDRYFTEAEITTKLSTKSDTTHTHTFASITARPTTVSGYGITDTLTTAQTNTLLAGKSDTTHTHDDRYYTETEMNTKLNAKSDSTHTHTFASVTAKPTTISGFGITDSYTSTQVNNLLKDKSDTGHTHDYLELDGGTLRGATYGIFPSTANTVVGNEYNILLNAHRRSEITITQTGTALMDVSSLFDGRLAPTYSSLGIPANDPTVLLIEGIPNIHTQTGGAIGWTSRYYYPSRFKIEGYDTYENRGWRTIYEQVTSKAYKDFHIQLNTTGNSGSLTKLRFTFYESVGAEDSLGNKRLGLSEIYFINQEGMKVHEFLDVDTVDGKHASDFAEAIHSHDDRYYTETEMDGMLANKSNTNHSHAFSAITSRPTTVSGYGITDTHTKTEVNNLLSGKSDNSHTHDDRYYTESEIDTKMSGKSDTSHVHTFASLTTKPTTVSGYGITDTLTTAQTNTLLAGKSDTSHVHTFATITAKPTTVSGYGITDTHTKTEVTTLLAGKSDTTHVHTFASLTSKPTTISGYSISDAYTKTEVDTRIAGLVNSAPTTLDTLKELANALGDDPNFATTVTTAIGKKANSTDVYTKTELQTNSTAQVHWANLTNVPTSFVASGGNSDTVGGLRATSFMRTDQDTATTGSITSSKTVSSNGLVIGSKFTIQYNAVDDSLDFVYN